MQSLHVLHLSDLHLRTPVPWNQQLLLKALKQDLEHYRFSQNKPDLLIFSGDFVQAADADNAHEGVFELISDILSLLEIDDNRVIITSGNHDIQRSAVEAKAAELIDYRAKALSRDGCISLFDSAPFIDYVKETQANHRSFSEVFTSSSKVDSSIFHASYYFRELGVAVVELNSSTLSAAGSKLFPSDLGALAFSEKILLGAFDNLPEGVPVMVVTHHPTSWLNEASKTAFERVVQFRGSFLLSGHLHKAKPAFLRTPNGSMFSSQAGALYSDRVYWNGYAVLSIEPNKLYVRNVYRRWFETRMEFGKAEELANDGVFFSSGEAQTYWQAINPPIDRIALDRWRATSLVPAVKQDCDLALDGRSLDLVFVEPEFEREIPYRAESDNKVGSRLEFFSLKRILSSRDNFVISAQQETGKSTLLRHIALTLAKEPTSEKGWSIPVLLNFENFRGYKAYVEGLIRQKLPSLPREVNANDLLSAGLITLLFDDVDFALAQKRDALVSFITSYPKCRYILASSTPFVNAAALQPEIAPGVPFSKLQMRPFRKSQLLTLVENHGLRDPLIADRMVERVMRDASALNVPLTAVTGTFLIQIIREEPDSSVINQAALIERYIEILLQKYAPRELLPGAFDFKNKVDLLGHIAEAMARKDDSSPEENVLLTWCIDYLRGFVLTIQQKTLY